MENLDNQKRNQVLSLMKGFENRDDRSVSILSGAYLENELCDLLKAAAKADHRFTDRLIGINLSTFNSKIDAAYCKSHPDFCLISREQFRDLHKVRQIRNKFAHRFIDLSFETPEISQQCACLEMATVGGTPSEPRDQFIKAVSRIMVDIYLKTRDLIQAEII